MDPRPDAELMASAQAGDAAALEALLVRHAPAVMRFARRLCSDPVEADDVVQETLIAAARGLPGLRSDRAISTWLYAVTRSFCAKKRRRSKHAPLAIAPLDEAAVADGAGGPDDRAASRELGGALEQAIRSLDPKYREVLVLRDIEGLSAAEVAETLSLQVDAVKSRLHRARAQVRDRMAPMFASGPAAACPDVVEQFSRFVEGDIGPAECAAMQGHVATCASCNAACASLKRTVHLCEAAGDEIPDDVISRVRASLRAVVGETSGKDRPA